MRTQGDIAREKLEAEGWECSHTATVNKYMYAGCVSSMQSRNGYDYCRVHQGKVVGKRPWQLTYVMRRKSNI